MTKARIALWDNARFVAIALVVLGHALTKTVAETDSSFVLYVTIYLFHIPLFVFLSGFFASAEAPTPERIKSVVVDLLIPYLIFEFIWSMIQSVQAEQFLFNPLRPSWTLWFLLSLAAWRILLPYLVQIPMPLLVSTVLAVWSGYWSVDQTLSLSRTLAFLPFFVLGWHAKAWGFQAWWQSRSPRQVVIIRTSGMVWLVGVLTLVWQSRDVLREWGIRKLLTADTGYVDAGFEQWFAGGFRVGLFVLATTMIGAFVVSMPRRHLWISSLGAGTMTVYLLHSFVLAPLRATPVLSGSLSWWHLALIVVGSIALTVVLALPATQRAVKLLIRPTWVLPKPSVTQ